MKSRHGISHLVLTPPDEMWYCDKKTRHFPNRNHPSNDTQSPRAATLHYKILFCDTQRFRKRTCPFDVQHLASADQSEDPRYPSVGMWMVPAEAVRNGGLDGGWWVCLKKGIGRGFGIFGTWVATEGGTWGCKIWGTVAGENGLACWIIVSSFVAMMLEVSLARVGSLQSVDDCHCSSLSYHHSCMSYLIRCLAFCPLNGLILSFPFHYCWWDQEYFPGHGLSFSILHDFLPTEK
ncbi:hypothetical protein B0J11DRAFT_7151 [Dendryphion nanum]|uniref:Uncharacterized protein n=1 Tax=Dendryphion nanum TaxID=256645 RepID=A0A9P9EHU1_9PLEO|nr:hypothetical protein B0J11DRAFT_7151 [Dendryphion nanum]